MNQLHSKFRYLIYSLNKSQLSIHNLRSRLYRTREIKFITWNDNEDLTYDIEYEISTMYIFTYIKNMFDMTFKKK